MSRAPVVEPPSFPGVFVLHDACETREGVLFFQGQPVNGAVVQGYDVATQIHQRARIDTYRDGLRIGSWEDPLFGIDLSRCYLPNDVDPEPDDMTSRIWAFKGRVTTFEETLRQVSYGFWPDGAFHEYSGALTAIGGASAHARWSWWELGTLQRVSVEMTHAGGRTSMLIAAFDKDGYLTELRVSGSYFQDIDDLGIESDRWIPRRSQDIFALEPAAVVKISELGDFKEEAIRNAPRWLGRVERLESVTSHPDLELVGRLASDCDFTSIRLPSFSTSGRSAPDPEAENRDLVRLATDFMRSRPDRTADFFKVAFRTTAQARPLTQQETISSQYVILDEQAEEVVALEVFRLEPVLTEMAIASTKLEYVHIKSSGPTTSDELLRVVDAHPDIDAWVRGHPQGHEPLRGEKLRDRFNEWLASR